MVSGTEKLIRKFAKGYERRSGSAARYVASEDMNNLIAELISEFSGICIGLRKDRGQGVLLSVMSSETRALLYSVRVRNTDARGLNRSKVRYSLTLENRDVILEFR
jgi:hypothetical protein